MASKLDHLLWIDIETTGLDTNVIDIVDIGAILTTTDLIEIESYESLAEPSKAQWAEVQNNTFLRQMHIDNGLTEALDEAHENGTLRQIGAVEADLIDLIARHGAAIQRIAVCGSGVAKFDYQVMMRVMPDLMKYMTYYVPIDTGVIGRSYELATGSTLLMASNEKKTHRGIDDIRCHLADARVQRNAFRLLAGLLESQQASLLDSGADV